MKISKAHSVRSQSAPNNQVLTDAMPKHIAIIMDGNGRWARMRRLPRIAGHRRGAETARKIIEAAAELGVTHMTLFAFSTENWCRPEDEVSELMGLLRFYLHAHVADLHEKNVRLKIIGKREGLPGDIRHLADKAEILTADNSGIVLAIALNYGARQDLVSAVRSLALEVEQGKRAASSINEALISSMLSTSGFPNPDLIIRTSGEKRVSNFLLWESAYAEFFFIDKLWPDVTRQDLETSIHEFSRRERRFGATAS